MQNNSPNLELPKTIRALELNEVPLNPPSIRERYELRKTANIVEGYRIFDKDDNPTNENLAFNFFAEININNSKLWDLCIELSEHLPSEIALIFHHEDEEVIYGRYENKQETLDFLQQYKTEIISDPFINIGMIFHTDTKLIEIFIPESKYIKFWGVDEASFRKTMSNFQLKEIDNIEFIDEYPKVREALNTIEKNVVDSINLIELLKRRFQ
jgi:sucrose-6-phosphate hydrolase SacC (GH32 family)